MRKYTRKEIRNYVALGLAKDITDYSFETVKKMDVNVVGLSHGIYGMNAGLFQDRKTGEFYVVRDRSRNLFVLA